MKQPTKFELGLTIPPSLLLRADQVIEEEMNMTATKGFVIPRRPLARLLRGDTFRGDGQRFKGFRPYGCAYTSQEPRTTLARPAPTRSTVFACTHRFAVSTNGTAMSPLKANIPAVDPTPNTAI